jgi:hypothetical protein
MRRTAVSTWSKFSIGSPMPIKTIVCSRPSAHQRFAPQGEKLLDDFPGGEIAFEARFGRCAEIAPHGAANLRGDAPGRAIRPKIGHEHGLNRPAILELQQKLGRAVLRHLPRQHRRPAPRLLRLHALLQSVRQHQWLPCDLSAARIERPEHARGVRRFKAPRRNPLLEACETVIRQGDQAPMNSANGPNAKRPLQGDPPHPGGEDRLKGQPQPQDASENDWLRPRRKTEPGSSEIHPLCSGMV